MIEQKTNNIKNKNNHNNISQENTLNNISNNITYNEIPYNNKTYKSKNLIQNLFKKETEKTVQTNNSNKAKNKLRSTSKKLKNVPSACNIKVINKGNNNKNSIVNTPINVKNNKNEIRNKSSLNRIVKNLPKSAKSSTNLKSNRTNENENLIGKETEIVNNNEEKILKLEELFNKAKEEIKVNSLNLFVNMNY